MKTPVNNPTRVPDSFQQLEVSLSLHSLNLRETNAQQREENPKTSPENLINTMSALSFPKLPGDVKD